MGTYLPFNSLSKHWRAVRLIAAHQSPAPQQYTCFTQIVVDIQLECCTNLRQFIPQTAFRAEL